MPLVEITLDVKMDGKPALGQPLVLTTTVSEAVQLNLLKSGSDGSSYFGYTRLATDYGVFLQTDTQINVGLLNQSTGLTLSPGGIILIAGASMAAGANLNMTINNNSGSQATIKGFEYGP